MVELGCGYARGLSPGREAGWHKAPALSGNREPWAAGPAQILTCLGPWKVTGPHLAFVKDGMGVLDEMTCKNLSKSAIASQRTQVYQFNGTEYLNSLEAYSINIICDSHACQALDTSLFPIACHLLLLMTHEAGTAGI